MAVTEDQRALNNFVEYLKIHSDHPQPDNDGCVRFLGELAAEIGLKSKVVQLDPERPAIIITWEGQSPQLPAILLNSHYDVVPVFKEEWKYDPFSAYIDDKGDIYARGAQDMKSVTIAQLEAIRRMKSKGIKLKRTVHITVAPDEEVGGEKGMKELVKTEEFRQLNVGFDLDEGVASFNNEDFFIFLDEKSKWSVNIHCPGTTGHGSLLHQNTAGEKIRIVIDEFMDFRQRQAESADPKLGLEGIGYITVLNLTILQGGVQNNVVPPELIASFDIRVPPNQDHDELANWIETVCKKAGEGVYAEYEMKDPKAPPESVCENEFTEAVYSTLKKLNVNPRKVVCYGTTDARYVRQLGIPAIGLSPFLNTEWHFHGTDEYMNSKVFLQGIDSYELLIEAMANV